MTSDLVKRLRLDGLPNSIKEEAADRIEALEAALREIIAAHVPTNDMYTMVAIARAALAPAKPEQTIEGLKVALWEIASSSTDDVAVAKALAALAALAPEQDK